MPKKRPVAREVAGAGAERIATMKGLFPEVFSEGKLHVDKLRTAIGDMADDRPERLSFTWAGKKDAIRLIQEPGRGTLVPCPKEAIDWEKTKNIFIEGENLESLKLLYKAYAGRVKAIYIDPPYNTGNDFIYADNYADPLDTYLKLTGQRDSEGNLMMSNPETSGRYHSAWLSMMYPRLFLARQLLMDEGIILVSIGDRELQHLRMLMNELFGEENVVATLVWEKGRKNDAKLFSVGHEYMVVYARSLDKLKEAKTVWREEKPGAREIWDEYLRLRGIHGNADKKIERQIQEWFKSLPKTHPSKKWARYRRIDANGPWRDRDISWPGGDGPTFDVPHPVTGKPCKVPERGWIYSSPEVMQRKIDLGLVEFREDHTEPPFRKAHLRPVHEELEDMPNDDNDEEDNGDDELAMQVRGSYFYKQSQVAVKYLRKLMGAKMFDNPKDHEEIAKLLKYLLGSCTDAVILDFFGGSGSTAEAVLQINREKGTSHKFIIVQLPEPCNPKERSGKAALAAGLATIAAIAKERIRRVIKKYSDEDEGKLDLNDRGNGRLGFRVFKLAESNYRQWQNSAGKNGKKYADQVEAFLEPLVPGWKAENVIWEVAIKEGYSPLSSVKRLKDVKDNKVWEVNDPETGQTFRICLDGDLESKTLRAMNLGKDDCFICLDSALDDSAISNLALQCRLKTI